MAIKAAIVGATGYTGLEIAGLLTGHPEVEIASLTALVEEEKLFSDIFPRFKGSLDIPCRRPDTGKTISGCDVVFLALPHTVSMGMVPALLKAGKRVIDLSADYRLPLELFERWYCHAHCDIDGLEEAVYGLPELNRREISTARLVANPGCYPTSVILGLKPIARFLSGRGTRVIIDAKTGVTGAGRKASLPLSFAEMDGDLRSYKVNEHQHMPEMEHVLSMCAGGPLQVSFVPHLVPLSRGIFSTIHITGLELSGEELWETYDSAYAEEPFVRVRRTVPRLADVTGTNFCDIGMVSKDGLTVVVSVIDNLLKGAAGQAVQNMNIMFSFDENVGLA